MKHFLGFDLEVVEKPNKCKRFFAPRFLGKGDPDFSAVELLARFTVHRLPKFGRVPFADLRLRSLAMKCRFCAVVTCEIKLF